MHFSGGSGSQYNPAAPATPMEAGGAQVVEELAGIYPSAVSGAAGAGTANTGGGGGGGPNAGAGGSGIVIIRYKFQ